MRVTVGREEEDRRGLEEEAGCRGRGEGEAGSAGRPAGLPAPRAMNNSPREKHTALRYHFVYHSLCNQQVADRETRRQARVDGSALLLTPRVQR